MSRGSPVIYIPGILGSQLYLPEDGKKLWFSAPAVLTDAKRLDIQSELSVKNNGVNLQNVSLLEKEYGVLKQDVFLVEPVDTEQTLYPVAYTSWEFVKNQYHGVSAVEEAIPNQIEVNKLWAMALLFQKNNSFTTTFYDKTKIERWNPRPGAVVGVVGNPNEAMATSFKPHDMSNQIVPLVERTINLTKEFMGANDAVLGNINPQNTSAIVAVQKASAAPLELQKLSLYQFIEDYIRIVVDIIRSKYGIRAVEGENGQQVVDFSQLEYNKNFKVDIGASAYFSENAQIETMNNLWAAGIIKDAKLLVESMPDKFVPNKNKIIQNIEEYEAQQQALIQGGLVNAEM